MGFASTDDKAAIETYLKEIVEKAKAVEVTGEHGGLVVTNGYVINLQKVEQGQLYLIDEHHWFGKADPKLPFPPSLQWRPLRVPPFKHLGPLPEGSAAGLVYADGLDSTARKWIVAFDMVNRKVYVEAGPTGSTDWNVVKEKLDRSGEKSEYEDPILGGQATGFFAEGTFNLFAVFTN